MEKRKKVVVYGSSLFMAGILTSLKADPILEVICVSPDSPIARHSLDKNSLAAIIFDMTDPSLKLDAAVVHNRPGLLLIGVDPNNDEILVLSSRPVQAHNMAELVKVIEQGETTSNSFE